MQVTGSFEPKSKVTIFKTSILHIPKFLSICMSFNSQVPSYLKFSSWTKQAMPWLNETTLVTAVLYELCFINLKSEAQIFKRCSQVFFTLYQNHGRWCFTTTLFLKTQCWWTLKHLPQIWKTWIKLPEGFTVTSSTSVTQYQASCYCLVFWGHWPSFIE